jgi:plasmid stabilization system protein ParE
MTYPVFLTSRAVRDIDGILSWIAERSTQGAIAWARRWDDVVDQLGQHPRSFALAPEGERHHADIRQVIFKTRKGSPYRALFVVRDDRVFVMHVRGPGQDPVALDELYLPD